MTTRLDLDVRKQLSAAMTVDVSERLDFGEASIVVLFGPSGSGKTTILRAIAGLDRDVDGKIAFGDEPWLDSSAGLFVAPQRRRIGMLFQDYALFPHLSVASNIAYGPGEGREERERRAGDLARMLRIEDLMRRGIAKLSGGERQRVALARALASGPRLVLLDEPLSALDAPSRERLRLELRTLLRSLAIPAIVVTHDRTEAISLGDEVVVVIDGRVRQRGAPETVFGEPADRDVARSVGVETVVPADVVEVNDGVATVRVGDVTIEARHEAGIEGHVYVCIRAEDVTVGRAGPVDASARNHLPGEIVAVVREESMARIVIDCGFRLVALVTRQSCDELALREGDRVNATIKALAVRLVPHAG